jgi:dethiobiotin synthetase
MTDKNPPGLFITGTNTGVGKTHVGTLIAAELRTAGLRVGVYKPAASGCSWEPDGGQQDDDFLLWTAAGRPGELHRVCPQRFRAPLAPHLAARAEGRTIDPMVLRTGLEYWRQTSDVVLVEGAGGLMSPLGDEEYVADLALDLGYPLLVVAPNILGVINQTLQTLITAATFRTGLPVAGIVLNDLQASGDSSSELNLRELETRCVPPVLARVRWRSEEFDRSVDWIRVAQPACG